MLVTARAAAAVVPLTAAQTPGHKDPGTAGGVSVPSMAVPLLLVPAGLLLLESRTGLPLYQDRYVLYGQAERPLAGGRRRAYQWLAAAARLPVLIVVPGAALCLFALLLQLPAQDTPACPPAASSTSAAVLLPGGALPPGDAVLFMNSFYRKAELAYPPSSAGSATSRSARPRRGVVRGHRQAPAGDHSAHARPEADLGDRAPPSLPSLRLPAGPQRAESLILLRHYTRVTKRWYTNVCLTLWVRAG